MPKTFILSVLIFFNAVFFLKKKKNHVQYKLNNLSVIYYKRQNNCI